MIIEKILKQLTPERIRKEIEEMQEIKIPPELQKWVKEYEKVGKRKNFIWKWAYRVAQIITFPGVPRRYQRSLSKTKFLMIMFIVLLDDVSDEMQNKKLLDEILKIPFEENYIKTSQLSQKEKRYLDFTIEIWHFIQKIIRGYPYYQKFRSILEYDTRQLLNGTRYAYLVNQNLYLANEIEYQIYLSYNTPVLLNYMIDLTCLPKFDVKNLWSVRKIAWYAQLMTRIDNWISTWEREIEEDDFTSGVFVYALENNIVEVEMLRQNRSEEIVEKIKKSKTEEYFLKQWEKFYNEMSNLIKKNKSIDGKEILEMVEELAILHLVSKGFI